MYPHGSPRLLGKHGELQPYPIPHQSTYSSQSVARESTSSSASFLTQAPGTAPRGHVVSMAGRQAFPAFQLATLSQRVFRFPMLHPSLSSTLTKAAPLLWPLPGHVFLNVIYFQRMGCYLCSVQPPRPPEPVLEGRDLFCFDHRVDSRVPFSRTFAGPAHP